MFQYANRLILLILKLWNSRKFINNLFQKRRMAEIQERIPWIILERLIKIPMQTFWTLGCFLLVLQGQITYMLEKIGV